jgi:hypothetical membrane protein
MIDLNIAGSLLFISGVVSIMGIITAETTYPGYSTRTNYISDLAATRPPNSVIKQPAATIFTITVVFCGVLTLASAYFVYRGLGQGNSVAALALLIALSGIGALGAAAFNEQHLAFHSLFSFLSFITVSLAAIVSYFVSRAPFCYFAVILGIIALVNFGMLSVVSARYGEEAGPIASRIGPGGVERWISYPITLWSIGFGAYLMGP